MIQRKNRKTKKLVTSFLKETVENADLHKAVLNKAMITKEYCVIYDFLAPLKNLNTFGSFHLFRADVYLINKNVVFIQQLRRILIQNKFLD